MLILQCLIVFIILAQLAIVYALVKLVSIFQELSDKVNFDVNRLITRVYRSSPKSSD